jgi:hypothetical protein
MTSGWSGEEPRAAHVSGVSLSGANPGDYLIDDRCQGEVAPSSSCQIGVRFDPQRQGSSTATLTLITNAATPPAAVSLAGTGGQLPQGATGPQGASGKVELVICKTVTETVKHKKRKRQVCVTKVVTGIVKFTTSGGISASLSRHGIVYATGAGTHSRSGTRLLLRAFRRLAPGRYTLALTSHEGRRATTSRQQVTIA